MVHEFDQGFTPAKIVEGELINGELFFHIKWKEMDAIDVVHSKDAHKKCPQLVIKFYESRIHWID